jgi:hypothetical protein
MVAPKIYIKLYLAYPVRIVKDSEKESNQNEKVSNLNIFVSFMQ